MSDLRIALVAEGPTDYVILEAALKAFLGRDFVLIQLQPEATQPEMGSGWCGVLKWCYEASKRCIGPVDQDTTLSNFDLLILHLDVDVSTFQYGNCGQTTNDLAIACNWGDLPCAQVCPPVSSTCDALKVVVDSWLGQATLGQHSVLCLPAHSSGTWLAAATLGAAHPLLANAECDIQVEANLERLPLQQRIKKRPRDYRNYAPVMTENWQQVKNICTQAQVFEQDVLNAIP